VRFREKRMAKCLPCVSCSLSCALTAKAMFPVVRYLYKQLRQVSTMQKRTPSQAQLVRRLNRAHLLVQALCNPDWSQFHDAI
jgi:hypothetical protein